MCPLCKEPGDHLMPTLCNVCYPKFMAERELAKKQKGIMPESIINGDDLMNRGFNAWRVGKGKQLVALDSGKSEEEAEKIGFKEMERAAQEERGRNARFIAYHTKKQNDLNRLFRHI